MNTPDPNNPKPGDRFINRYGVTWEVRAIDGDAAWVINPANGARCDTSLTTIATWTPVPPTPPDVWAAVDADELEDLYFSEGAARREAERIGGKVARYTFAEWVTP